jgi:hypothetical protein
MDAAAGQRDRTCELDADAVIFSENQLPLFGITLFACQGDRVDMPSVVRLGPVRGAAEAEKSFRLRIGAKPDILDLLYAGAIEPRGDIARKIKKSVPLACRRTEEVRA